MGLLGKLNEKRMKDPVEGTLQIVGMTMPDPSATSCNYRMDAVVTADGIPATAIVHHGMASTSKWPSVGDQLPVTVDKAKPERIVIHWDKLPTGREQAQTAAQQLAEQMRSGGSSIFSGEAISPSAAGGSGNLVESIKANLAAGMDPEALAAQLRASGANVTVTHSGSGADETDLPTVSSADIIARGTAGSATLLGTFPTDVPCPKPQHTLIGLMLNVMVDGHPPFQVQNLYAVPDAKTKALTPNALLPVKVVFGAQNIVAVDWDATTA